VKFLVNLPKSLIRYVSIDLGCTNIAVSKHHLNRAQVRSVLQQMGGKAMSEQMWGDVTDPYFLAISNYQLPKCLTAEAMSYFCYEQFVSGLVAG